MGARGPAPKPTKLKILSGNPGKRKLNKREPKPASGSPTCPTWLSKEAKKAWKEIVPELAKIGLISVVDKIALSALCQAWAEFEISTKTLNKKNGRLFTMETGYVGQHPAVAQQRSAWQAIKMFCALFGLDPSSRSRLSLPEKPAEPTALEKFLAEKTQRRAAGVPG